MATLKREVKKLPSESNLRLLSSLIVSLANKQSSLEDKCIAPWKADETYQKDISYVSHNGYVYICSVTNQDSTFTESHWVKLSDNITELTKDDISALINLSPEEISKLSDLISTEIRLDKVFSSSDTYMRIQAAIETAKEYTNEQTGKCVKPAYKVVASTSEVTETGYFYLISNGTNFDMYVLSADGTAVSLGTSDIDLSDYAKLTDLDNYYDKSTSDGKFALITTVDGKASQTDLDNHVGDATIHITQDERTKWNNATNEERVKEIVDSEMTAKGVCTTSVADVPWTKITPTTDFQGNIRYRVKNGFCYVKIDSLTSDNMTTIGQTIATGFPKPEQGIEADSDAWYPLGSKLNSASDSFQNLLVRVSGDGSIINYQGTDNTDYYGFFSYPVAES